MAYNAWSVTYGEQPSATKWNYLGTNDAFFEDFILGTNGVHAAWTSFTPSWTNLTAGNGTNTGAYVKYGTTVFFRTKFTFGSTSSMGSNPSFAYPVTKNAAYGSNLDPIGVATGRISGNYYDLGLTDRTGISPVARATAGAYASFNDVTATAPATWANGDLLITQGFYQATS